MPLSLTWDAAFEATPAGSNNAAEGDDRIRELKVAVRERLEVDHSMAGDANDGQHGKVTLKLRTGDPSTVENRGYLYIKDAEGKVALYWKDEDGNVFRASRAGYLLANGMYLSDDGSAKGPSFRMMRHSNTPGASNGDTLAALEWWLSNSVGTEVQGAQIDAFVVSGANGDHDVLLTFKTAVDGTLANRFNLWKGLYRPAGTDPGVGSANLNALYIQDRACKVRHYGTRATMDPIVPNTVIAPVAHDITVPAGYDSAGYFARVILECKAGSGGDHGYAEGQMLSISDVVVDSGSVRGIIGFADATNVSLVVRGTPFLVDADAGGQGAMDPDKWKAHVDPYVELSYPVEPPP